MTAMLHEALCQTARANPDATALVCDGARLSYATLAAAADGLARGLVRAGVMPGDRVVVHLDNSVETVVTIFAVLAAGAVFSVVHPSAKGERLAAILRDTGAAALVARNDPRRRRLVHSALAVSPTPLVIWVGRVPESASSPATAFLAWEELRRTSGDTPVCAMDADALASIIYTSGTTGGPKGVMSAHRDMLFAARAMASYLGNTAADVVFSALPLAHTYGLYQLLTVVLVGATLVLERNFAFPARALEIMSRERVTGFAGVPTMYAVLLKLDALPGYDLSSLRYLTNAAAPLSVPQIRAVRAAFPQAAFFSMYGQTECKRGCYLPPEEIDSRPDSVGVPLPGTVAYVLDDAGQEVPPGAPGELVLAGPHLMRGYWGRPEETAARLRPDPVTGEPMLHTGDLFRRDEEGFLYFLDRADDVIKCRGEKVSPREIEDVLRTMPGVGEVAAVGVPDEVLGQAVKVVVVPQPGATLAARDVRAFCARHLEEFLVPSVVEFRSELPMTDSGKTIRRGLATCVA